MKYHRGLLLSLYFKQYSRKRRELKRGDVGFVFVEGISSEAVPIGVEQQFYFSSLGLFHGLFLGLTAEIEHRRQRFSAALTLYRVDTVFGVVAVYPAEAAVVIIVLRKRGMG